jgi:hypothetical protein
MRRDQPSNCRLVSLADIGDGRHHRAARSARQKPRPRDRQEKRSKASRGQHFSASDFSAISTSRRTASAKFGMPGWRARHASYGETQFHAHSDDGAAH